MVTKLEGLPALEPFVLGAPILNKSPREFCSGLILRTIAYANRGCQRVQTEATKSYFQRPPPSSSPTAHPPHIITMEDQWGGYCKSITPFPPEKLGHVACNARKVTGSGLASWSIMLCLIHRK